MTTISTTRLTTALALGLGLLAAGNPAGAGELAPTTSAFTPYEKLELSSLPLHRALRLDQREVAALLETRVLRADGTVEARQASPRQIGAFRRHMRAERRRLLGAPEPTVAPRQVLERAHNPDARRRTGRQPADDGEALGAETVIGQDDRIPVQDTTPYPYRAAGMISLDGRQHCTGTLIGPRHVLTAAHCVFDVETQQWYDPLAFTPGQNGRVRPFGTVAVVDAFIFAGWAEGGQREFDVALLVVDQDIGEHVGWLGFAPLETEPGFRAILNGYPGDKPEATMWHAFCPLEQVLADRLYYACDTAGGMSGSAVHEVVDGDVVAYGVHTNGTDQTGLNSAVRLHRAFFEAILSWKQTS